MGGGVSSQLFKLFRAREEDLQRLPSLFLMIVMSHSAPVMSKK